LTGSLRRPRFVVPKGIVSRYFVIFFVRIIVYA
jgi:hypothetical protein